MRTIARISSIVLLVGAALIVAVGLVVSCAYVWHAGNLRPAVAIAAARAEFDDAQAAIAADIAEGRANVLSDNEKLWQARKAVLKAHEALRDIALAKAKRAEENSERWRPAPLDWTIGGAILFGGLLGGAIFAGIGVSFRRMSAAD